MENVSSPREAPQQSRATLLLSQLFRWAKTISQILPVSGGAANPSSPAGLGLAFGAGGIAICLLLLYTILHASLASLVMLPLVAVVFALAVYEPRWGLYVTVGALPLTSWMVEAFHTSYFVPGEVLTGGLLAGCLVRRAFRPGFRWRPPPLAAWLLALVAVYLASALVELKAIPLWPRFSYTMINQFPEALTLHFTDAYLNPGVLWPLRSACNILTGLILFLLVVQLVETAEHRRRVVIILLAAGLAVSAYGLFQIAFQHHLWRGHYMQSTMVDRNSLGSFLVLTLGVWAGQWLGGGPRKRFVLSVAAGVLLVCLLGTTGRAAWLGGLFVLAGFAWIFLRAKPRRLQLKVALAAVAVALAMVAGLAYTASRLDVRQDFADAVGVRIWYTFNPRQPLNRLVNWRFDLWAAALDALADAPATGIGIGRFYASPYIVRRFGRYEHAHSYFLQIAAEVGLLGLGVWLGLLAMWLRDMRRARRAAVDGPNRWTLFGLTLGVAGYLVAELVSHSLILPVHQLLFWSVIGLGCTAFPATPLSRQAKWCLAGLVAVLAVSLWFRNPMPPAPQPSVTPAARAATQR